MTQENVLITVFSPNTVPRGNLGKLKKICNLMHMKNVSIKHTGSPGGMEVAGLVDCVKSSIQNRGLIY